MAVAGGDYLADQWRAFLLIAAGAVVLLARFIKPLRFLWTWFLQLPLDIRVGLDASLAGILLLVATVLSERIEDPEKDRGLSEDH